MNTAPISEPDSELLTRFVRFRDELAFARLVHQYQPMVIGAALRRTRDLESAKEVAQTVFIALARRAALLMERGKLAGWLYQAASYQGARSWDAEVRRRRRQEQAALYEPRDHDNGRWEELEIALQGMSGNEREAIVLHYFQDRSHAEMAADLGLNEAAVRKRLSRALQSLGRRLQRHGSKAPALSLLTGAVAFQATIPAQASIAGAALSASTAGTGVPFFLTLTAMTSNTLIKATLIVLALSAVPMAWQQSKNNALRREVAMLRPPPKDPALEPGAMAPQGTDPGLAARLAQAQAELAALQQERAKEADRLASLQKQALQLQEEVVISLGRVDDVARRVAEFSKLVMEMDAAGQDAAKQVELAKEFMPKVTEMMPVLAEMSRISSKPDLHARLDATTFATLAGLSDPMRDQMQRLLLPYYQAMQRGGLTLDRRPAERSEDWDRRYGEASATAMRGIEHLLPMSVRESKMWQDTVSPVSEGHRAFLDMLTRKPSAPKVK